MPSIRLRRNPFTITRSERRFGEDDTDTMKKMLWILSLCLLTGCGLYRLNATEPPPDAQAVVSAAPTEAAPTVEVQVSPASITVELTAEPTPTPTPSPAPTPTPEPTPTPTPTPEPTPVGLLGGRYDGFWYGEGHVKNEGAYISDTVSVTMETVTSSPLAQYLVYYVVDIHIQDIEALRTESWDGGNFSTRAVNKRLWVPFMTMVKNVNPIAAINGDYYAYDIKKGLVIRNGVRYAPDPWKGWKGRDILLLNRDGTMETYPSDTFDADSRDLSNVWQAWEFGPSLLNEDGTAKTKFNSYFSSILSRNPRTVIGYYEPGHYCFVVIDGRSPRHSNGLTMEDTAKLMESLGCKLAFNLDGGETSQFYWNGEVANVPFRGGRWTSDIIYVTDPDALENEPELTALPDGATALPEVDTPDADAAETAVPNGGEE